MFAGTYFAPTYFAPTYFLSGGAGVFVAFVPPAISVQDRVAASKTLICNMALGYISADKIESLDEASSQARQCSLWYDYTRLQALELHTWNFAKRRASLVAHADDPPDQVWIHRYVYPSDCIIIRKLEGPDPNLALNTSGLVFSDDEALSDGISFDVEHSVTGDTKSILTNQGAAVVVYTRDLEDVALFSPNFVRLLAAMLAANIAYPLTGKTEVEEKMNERVARLQRVSPAINANEQMKPPPRNAPWVRVRD